MVAVTLTLVVVKKVVWVVLRIVHNLQNVSFHLLGTGNSLGIIAIYSQ